MTAYIILISFLAIAAAVFLTLYIRSAGALAAEQTERARLQERAAALASEIDRLNSELQRTVADHARAQDEAEQRFSALASKVLISNSETLREQNRNGLAEVLAPMKSDLEQFRRMFTEYYRNEAGERIALGKHISELVALNNTVSQETRRLTDALKGNSRMQGDWGEMILDNILERSGLRRGEDYVLQQTVDSADGSRLRPDVVISYTEGRKLVIDSKVSIQDYIKMLNADNETARDQYARAHLASVRKHISELSRKSYQDYVGDAQVDFVLMFIPHEGAYLAAMNLDSSIWQTAYDNHVLIISPTHLVSVVRLVEQMWRHDRQNRNALEIAREASAMLDKFRGFVDDLDKIDNAIDAARNAWTAAFSKLTSGKGNLVARAMKISKLGAKSKKDLPDRYLSELSDLSAPSGED